MVARFDKAQPLLDLHGVGGFLRSAIILAGLCGCFSTAYAQEVSDRHRGVQLRGFIGPAFLYSVQDVGGGEVAKTRGFGVASEFALGTMWTDDLALNMDVLLAHSGSAAHGVLDDASVNAVHVGAGVTYWWMPANVYLAASLGLARSSVEGSPVRLGIEVPTIESSDLGIGAHLALGKQFWLTRRFCLGATLSLLSSIANNPVGGHDSNRHMLVTSVALTATLH